MTSVLHCTCNSTSHTLQSQESKGQYFVGYERAFESVFMPPTIKMHMLEADPRFIAASYFIVVAHKVLLNFTCELKHTHKYKHLMNISTILAANFKNWHRCLLSQFYGSIKFIQYSNVLDVCACAIT